MALLRFLFETEMADTQRALRNLKQASIHSRATKGRQGMTVWLEDAEDVLVAGDLHGNLTMFRKILALADLENHPNRHLVLQEFVHGNGRYPNGGCDSHRLLDVVAALKCQYPHRVHLLAGNHELSEWTGRAIAKNGVALNQLFAAGVEFAYGEDAEQVLEAYYQLIESMLLAVRTPNRVFMSHSVPPQKALDEFDVGILSAYGIPEEQRGKNTSLYHLLWGRDTSDATCKRFAKMVDADFLVTGHIAVDPGYAVPNTRQIIVDCTEDPAGCLLFSARTPMTLEDLVECICILPYSQEQAASG